MKTHGGREFRLIFFCFYCFRGGNIVFRPGFLQNGRRRNCLYGTPYPGRRSDRTHRRGSNNIISKVRLGCRKIRNN